MISYKGCFKDDILIRDLEITAWKENDENTVLKCIMRCYDYGYKYAGLQVKKTFSNRRFGTGQSASLPVLTKV